MSVTISTVSVELIFEELKKAVCKNKIEKLKGLQSSLDRLVKQVIKSGDLAALTLINEKSLDLILTTEEITASDLMIIFGLDVDEVELVCSGVASNCPASILYIVAFSHRNVRSCEELDVPFTILGRAYVNFVRSLGSLPNVSDIPSIFIDLKASILGKDLSRAKTIGSLISNIACNAIIENNSKNLSCIILNFSQLLQELFVEKKYLDMVPIIFNIDELSFILTKEAFPRKGGEDLFIGIALYYIYDSYGKYAFKDMAEFNFSYLAVTKELSTDVGHKLLDIEEGVDVDSSYKDLLLSLLRSWHFYSLGDKARCSESLKVIVARLASGEVEYSKIVALLGRDAQDLSDIILSKDKIAIALGISRSVLKGELFVSSRMAEPKNISADILNMFTSAVCAVDIIDVISSTMDRVDAWAMSKPLSIVNLQPMQYIIADSLRLISSSQDIPLFLAAVQRLYSRVEVLYNSGEVEAVTKLFSIVPFDYKYKILESLRLRDHQQGIKAVSDSIILESIRDDVSEYELFVEEHASSRTHTTRINKYHESVKNFHREVYTAIGLPEECDLADVYVSYETMYDKQMKIVTSAILDVVRADVSDADTYFERINSGGSNLDDFVKASTRIRKLLDHLVSRGQTEDYVAVLQKVKENVIGLLSTNRYDRALLFVSILQMDGNGYEEPSLNLNRIIEHSLDILGIDQNYFMMMMVAYNRETYYMASGSHLTSSIGIRSEKQKILELLGVSPIYVDFTKRSSVKGRLDEFFVEIDDLQTLMDNGVKIAMLLKILSIYSIDSNQASVYVASFRYILEKCKDISSVSRELRAVESLRLTQLSSIVRAILESKEGRQAAIVAYLLSSEFNGMAFRFGVREGEELRVFRENFLKGLLPSADSIILALERSNIFSIEAEPVEKENHLPSILLKELTLSAYMSADAIKLADLARTFIPTLQRLIRGSNYSALALLTGCSGECLEDLIVALECGKISLVYFYLFQNIANCAAVHTFLDMSEITRYARAFTEEFEEHLDGGSDLLSISDLRKALISIEDMSSYPVKAIILEVGVRLNQAFLEQDIESYAEILKLIKDVLLVRHVMPSRTSELLMLKILKLRPSQAHALFLNVYAKDEDEIIRQLNDIFLNNIALAEYGSIVNIAESKLEKGNFTKVILSHMKITIVDISQPFKLISNASLLGAATKELADYIRVQANRGVELSTFKEAAIAAKLEDLVLALAVPDESDTDRYRGIYLALNRAYLDHVLAHRFGIGGQAEFNGLEYDLDGSYTHTMVREMQNGYSLMKTVPVISQDDLNVLWIATGEEDNTNKDQVIAKIFADISEIEIQGWNEARYRERLEAEMPIALPTYTLLGEEGGHANGCVIFKKGREYFAIFSDRGGDIEFKDCGINIYRVGNSHLLANFVRRLSESNKDPIPGAEFKSLKESLCLEKLNMIEKKPHKSGTCGYSSAAKTIAQGIQYARFYGFAADKGIESAAAHKLAGDASNIFAKKFSLFDRSKYLSKYISECARLGVEMNIDLLSRIRLICGNKDKYREISSEIDSLHILETRHIENAQTELRGRIRASLLSSLGSSEVAMSMEMSFIDATVTEMVAMYTRGYDRAEIIEYHNKITSILKAREEAASTLATITDSRDAVVATGCIDATTTIPVGLDEEEETERLVIVDRDNGDNVRLRAK